MHNGYPSKISNLINKTKQNMRTVFLNTPRENRKQFRIEGRQHLFSRAEDFRFWMKNGTSIDDYQDDDRTRIAGFEEHGSFYDYGLGIDYVAPETFKNKRGYLRYQLSWGGPSEEIRFYLSPGKRPGSFQADRIEFVYLHWGTGVGFDVTKEDWAQWLFSGFEDTDIIQTKIAEANEN